ncbi:MAG: glutamate--tRNA ligase [Nanoarchaeota archaeon]
MSKKVRVRFAPSPTGPLHIGGVKTALVNYLYAKKHGGDFIIRVEDTDSKREVAGSDQYMFDSLFWLKLGIDESPWTGGPYGPYRQSERKDIYKKYVDELIKLGHAYYAFDTKEELDKMREDLAATGIKNTGYTGVVREKMNNSLRMSPADVKNKIDAGEPYVVRFKMSRNEDVKFEDKIRGWVTFNTKDLDDKVIWKSSDQLPTYHLANVVDDHLMEITNVIRGEEWLSSTPLHVLLYKAFGWEHPEFAHLPLILGPDGKKLGKRNKYGIPVFPLSWTYTDPDGVVESIQGFRELGYEPDALINFLALLGWSPGGNREFMSMSEMIELFDVDRINQAGARFDMVKLNSFNAHYLRSKNREWILEKMNIPENHGLSDEKLSILAKMATERVTFAHELAGSVDYIFNEPDLSGELDMKNVNDFVRVMNVFADDEFMADFNEDEWTIEHIKMELETISVNVSSSVGKIMPMLRLALTGGKPGPQLIDVMYVIGSKKTKNRINVLLSKIKETA